MYFMDAFQYPFNSDRKWGKILAAVILMCIPVLGQVILLGYGLKIIRSVLDGDTELPEFDLGNDLVQGIVAAIVSFVYCIPGMVISGLFSVSNSPNLALFLIYLIVSIVTSFMVIAALTRYAITEDTSALWAIRENLNIVTAYPGTIVKFYVNALLFGIVAGIALVIGFILLVIPGFIVLGALQFSTYYLYARWAEEVGLAANRKRKMGGTYA